MTVTPAVLYWTAVVLLVPLLAAPVAAYRYAVRTFDAYTVA